MKSRLTLCLLIALLFSAVIPVAGQTAMRNFKPHPSAVSMDEATVVDMEALPLQVAPSAAPQATFHDGGSILRSGLAYYPQGRWGDYTGTAIDGSSVWFSGMYANSSGLWNTGIGKTGYTSAAQP
jgi:hypothetical protein